MTLTATLEATNHLSGDDQIAARCGRQLASEQKTLDDAERYLRAVFFGWFVYRGGNHIALHRKAGDDRRVLIVTEA